MWRSVPVRSTAVPREDRSLDLGAAFRTHGLVHRHHEFDRWGALDRHGKWLLVVFTTRSQRHDCPIEKSRNAFDDVAIGHAHAHNRKTWLGGRPGEERSFAFEDSGQPMEIERVDQHFVRVW
jgi:hypothetical protein